jgi:hypothetical protein
MRKKHILKKKIPIEFLSGHLSFKLTRRVDQFTPSQLQAWNETDLTKAPDHPEKFKKYLIF